MSEYQYYEFLALSCPLSRARALSKKEIAELRACSTRARITSTSFVNHYEWGRFKGDEDAWMARYFDAFLYLSSWGKGVFKLRLPAQRIDLADAQQYDSQCCTVACKNNEKVVITFASQDDGGPEG